MPFYDLKCKDCGKEFNQLASMSARENKLIKCPGCGSTELDPVFRSVNIVQSRKDEAPSCPHYHQCGGCCGH